MPDDAIQKLLQGGIRALRSGDRELARRAFLQILKQQIDHEAAWIGLASSARDSDEAQRAIQKLLEYHPHSPKAQEAARRLGFDPLAIGPELQPDVSTELEPDPEPESEVDWEPEPDLEARFGGEPEPKWAPESEEAQPESTGQPDETVVMGDDLPDYLRGMDFDFDDEEEAAPQVSPFVPRGTRTGALSANLDEVLELLAQPQPGTDGVPLVDAASIEDAIQLAEQRLNERPKPADLTVEWVRKKRRRAGEAESALLNLRIAAAAILVLAVVGGLTASFLLSTPEVRSVVFAPTWTISPTPTFTATATPGVTPTPSPTAAISPTPSPTIDPSVTPGDTRPDQAPEPTGFYLPSGIVREGEVEEAARLMAEGEMDEAYSLLQNAREVTAASGNFLPYFYLSEWYLRRDDPETARQVADEGEERWRNSPSADRNYGPLVDVANARIDLYLAQEAVAEGRRPAELYTDIEERTVRAIENDSERFVEPFIIRSRRYSLDGDYEEALRVLDTALVSRAGPTVFTDERLRYEKAQIKAAMGDLDGALQELYELLVINPFNVDALRMQIELALAKNEPGLASIYAEQYLFYYPGSVIGYKLLGDARLAENKADLALLEYSRALQGDEEDPAYLDALLARANLYMTQGRPALAQADLSQALRLSGNDPAVRTLRMEAAYRSGSTAVALSDAESLLAGDAVPDAPVLLLQAQILVDGAGANDDEDLRTARQAINRAINLGLPPEDRPLADEYLARIAYGLDEMNEARNAIERAIGVVETGSRRYLRGLILEAQGDTEGALRDYEFVLTWSQIYPYPFREDARLRYEALREEDTS